MNSVELIAIFASFYLLGLTLCEYLPNELKKIFFNSVSLKISINLLFGYLFISIFSYVIFAFLPISIFSKRILIYLSILIFSAFTTVFRKGLSNLYLCNIRKKFTKIIKTKLSLIDIFYFMTLGYLIIKSNFLYPLDTDTTANYAPVVNLYIKANTIVDTSNWIGTFGRFSFLTASVIGFKAPLIYGTFINSLLGLSGTRLIAQTVKDLLYKFDYLDLFVFSLIISSNNFNIFYFYNMKNDPVNLGLIGLYLYIIKTLILNKNNSYTNLIYYFLSAILGSIAALSYSNLLYIPILLILLILISFKHLNFSTHKILFIINNFLIFLLFSSPTYFHNIILYKNPIFPFSFKAKGISPLISVAGNFYYENEIPKYTISTPLDFIKNYFELHLPLNWSLSFQAPSDPILFFTVTIFVIFSILANIYLFIKLKKRTLIIPFIFLFLSVINMGFAFKIQAILRYNLISFMLIIFSNLYLLNLSFTELNLKNRLIENKNKNFIPILIFILLLPFSFLRNTLRLVNNCFKVSELEYTTDYNPSRMILIPTLGGISDIFRIKDWRTDISDICIAKNTKRFDLRNKVYSRLKKINNGIDTINYLNEELPKNSVILINSNIRGYLRNDITAYTGPTALALFSKNSIIPNPNNFKNNPKLWVSTLKNKGIDHIIYSPLEFNLQKIPSDIFLMKKATEIYPGEAIPGGGFMISLDEI